MRYDRKEYAEAATCFEKAVFRAPKSALYPAQLGMALRSKGDAAGAAAAYQLATKLDPKFARAHSALARLLATGPDDVRDGREALAHATTACELTGWNDPMCLDALAAACAEAGDFGKAVEYQEKALTFPAWEPGHGSASRRRLVLYTHQKPYRDPTFRRLPQAPPPREVKRP